MKSIKEAGNLKGKKVILRSNLNEPIKDGIILDTERINASLPTIKFIIENGGKVIIIGHSSEEGASLKSSYDYLNTIIPATFVSELEIPEESVVVLENLRKWEGEEKNDPEFAKKLATLGDIYVNDDFSVSHRNHASVVELPKLLPSFAGFEFLREVENLSKVFNPPHPFLFILGGAKIETKLPLINKFLHIADEIFVGGALAQHVHEYDFSGDPKISLPVGDIAALMLTEESVALIKEKIDRAEFILWNGPLDNYENGYREGTINLAKILVASGKKVILGGGDTLTILKDENLLDKFYFVSTAGGAMLDFLANGTLPGIEALN